MYGTIRSYDDVTLERMKERIRSISENVAAAHEC
jgi:metal-dependent amidase/aminoacylase/carboxypeptidase family protein